MSWLHMGLPLALTKLQCPCRVDKYWAMLQMGETSCRCRAVTRNLYNAEARQQWLCASPMQVVFVLEQEYLVLCPGDVSKPHSGISCHGELGQLG